jgi:hypothetical protein
MRTATHDNKPPIKANQLQSSKISVGHKGTPVDRTGCVSHNYVNVNLPRIGLDHSRCKVCDHSFIHSFLRIIHARAHGTVWSPNVNWNPSRMNDGPNREVAYQSERWEETKWRTSLGSLSFKSVKLLPFGHLQTHTWKILYQQ